MPLLIVFAVHRRRRQALDGSALVPSALFRGRSFCAGLVVRLLAFDDPVAERLGPRRGTGRMTFLRPAHSLPDTAGTSGPASQHTTSRRFV
ncbi:hypothetical protein [Streptomyces sp. NPDC006195]|uniref:hypothetical protein n=1 Tax=unclassified Streptomyces TaxID=2593676 RepID=UPI0033AD8C60